MSIPPPGLGGGVRAAGPPPGFGSSRDASRDALVGQQGGQGQGQGQGQGSGMGQSLNQNQTMNGQAQVGQGTAVIVRAQIVFLLTTLTEDSFEKSAAEIRTVSFRSLSPPPLAL